MQIKFWGTRGSIPCSGKGYNKVGGNTSCVEIMMDDHIIIFDAGSGIRGLGQRIKNKANTKISLLFSHFHLDHVIGFPFFVPLWTPNFKIDIYGSNLENRGGIKEYFRNFFKNPFFPAGIDLFRAKVKYYDFNPGFSLNIASHIKIKTIKLNHPGGCIGYRLENLKEGTSIAYITDHEHCKNYDRECLLKFLLGVDLMIYDTQYCDSSYVSKIGWGHSTWQEGARLAHDCSINKWLMFHHDPEHNDVFLNNRLILAKNMHKGSLLAYDSLTIEI